MCFPANHTDLRGLEMVKRIKLTRAQSWIISKVEGVSRQTLYLLDKFSSRCKNCSLQNMPDKLSHHSIPMTSCINPTPPFFRLSPPLKYLQSPTHPLFCPTRPNRCGLIIIALRIVPSYMISSLVLHILIFSFPKPSGTRLSTRVMR